MNVDQILSEIREANLSYLMLAQSLIRADREQALYRLGISEENAALIALLSPAQMIQWVKKNAGIGWLGAAGLMLRMALLGAVREKTTLRMVLLQALNEYAAGAWPPRENEPRQNDLFRTRT